MNEVLLFRERSVDSPTIGLPELTVVLPTFNECQNVEPLLRKLENALAHVSWEAVFVDDDSNDGTPSQIVQSASPRSNVRIIRRIGRRGLSTAVVEGALSSMADYIAVMDADMQHDEAVLANMLTTLRSGKYDLVVGTRYAEGGGVGQWASGRIAISRFATRLAQSFTGVKISDPMSGFFMITRKSFETIVRRLSGQGFKILLDIATSSPTPLRIAEQPFTFKVREFGESKLDALVALEFVSLLLDKAAGGFVPLRFLLFVAVGGLGLAVHMAVLATALNLFGVAFAAAQGFATIVAMVSNFFMNNFLTYRDRRLKGTKQLCFGLLSFMAVCGLGALANVGIATMVFHQNYSWWLAGLAGVLVGAVWNYAATSVFTWREHK
jgi:dolichol-phosphate mannosyltransferase